VKSRFQLKPATYALVMADEFPGQIVHPLFQSGGELIGKVLGNTWSFDLSFVPSTK